MKGWTNFSRLGRLFVAAAVMGLLLLFGAPAAHAESLVVVTSSPADGATVPVSPATISITFNQPIGSAVTMTVTCNGQLAPVPSAKTSTDQLSMILDLSVTPLNAGNCAVDWQAQGLNGPVSSGSLSFRIAQSTIVTTPPLGPPTTLAASNTPAPTESAPTAFVDPSTLKGPLFLSRLLSSLGLAALFGALVLIAVAWPEGVEYVLTIRFLRSAWILALAGTVGVVTCLTAQSTGRSFSAALSPTTWTDLTDSLPGKAALGRLLLAAAAGWVAIRPERVIDPATQLPALALPGLAVATLGFSRSGGDLELVGYAAGLVHAIAMAVWFGGVVLLARVVLSGPGQEDLVHATRGFSRLATPALAATVLTGAVQMYRLDRGHLLESHGEVLLLKVAAVIAVVFVGVATRQFVQQRMTRVDTLSSALANRLRRAVGMEAAGGAVILLLTAWLLALQPGNLSAASGPGNYAFQKHFVDAKAANDVTVYVTPAKVGANAVFVKLAKPLTGVTAFTVTFSPPAGSTADAVILTPGLTGAGSASLPLEEGIPLGDAGSWTMTVSVLTVEGEYRDSANFSVLTADGTAVTATVPTVTAPVFTAPPTLPDVDPAAISTTTVTTP